MNTSTVARRLRLHTGLGKLLRPLNFNELEHA